MKDYKCERGRLRNDNQLSCHCEPAEGGRGNLFFASEDIKGIYFP